MPRTEGRLIWWAAQAGSPVLSRRSPPTARADAGIARKLVVNARAGVVHALGPVVTLGAGLFSDRSPDEPATDPVSAFGDFYGGTLGIELSNDHSLAPGEPADSLVFSTMFALRYGFSASQLELPSAPSRLD